MRRLFRCMELRTVCMTLQSSAAGCVVCAASLSEMWHCMLQHVFQQALGSTAPVVKASASLLVLLQQVDHSCPAVVSGITAT